MAEQEFTQLRHGMLDRDPESGVVRGRPSDRPQVLRVRRHQVERLLQTFSTRGGED